MDGINNDTEEGRITNRADSHFHLPYIYTLVLFRNKKIRCCPSPTDSTSYLELVRIVKYTHSHDYYTTLFSKSQCKFKGECKMSNGNLELRDRLQEIIAVKQGMAERLGKILFRNYLERATPKTKDAIALLVHD